jgi:hypothetical protein
VEIITTLNQISSYINQIVPIILLVAGTFGHVFNLIIFSKRSRRTNPISLYFLSATITDVLVIYTGCLIRYLQDVDNIDPVNNDLTACKIRSFVYYTSLSLSNWYILLATIDRYLISSEDNLKRQLSTIKNAYRIIACLTIIFILCYCHILILYNIQTSTNSSNRLQNYCYPQRGPYRTFSDSQILIQFSLLPPILMSVFVILIIKNIRASHKRIANTFVVQQNARIKKRDIQLSKMLLLQVIITIVCSLPLAISQLSTTMTLTWTKTPLRLTIEGFCAQIARNLAFFNCSVSFYLYTLSGSQFRLELQQSINQLSMFICRKRLLENRRIGIDPGLAAPNVLELELRAQHVPKADLNVNGVTSADTSKQI